MGVAASAFVAGVALIGTTSAANTSGTNLRALAQEVQEATCYQPANGVNQWWYNSWSDGAYYCTSKGDSRDWAMLRAYRSGGTEGTHWKYTNDANDGACMTNWGYYTSDGQTLKITVGRTTFEGDSRRWCALPVYRSGGVQGKQWAYCSCTGNPGRPDITMAAH